MSSSDPGALEVPEFVPQVLDEAALERFLAAVAFETTVRAIVLRGESFDRKSGLVQTLRAARDALRKGDATGMQIHYVHESGEEWFETLMRTEAGVRRVRVRQRGESR